MFSFQNTSFLGVNLNLNLLFSLMHLDFPISRAVVLIQFELTGITAITIMDSNRNRFTRTDDLFQIESVVLNLSLVVLVQPFGVFADDLSRPPVRSVC